MNNAPIGLFDSGVGGTSIWCAVCAELPQESTIFWADNAHAPYGDKSPAEIIELAARNTEQLLSRGCKMIIIACNTASAHAAAILRTRYNVPFVAVEPAIKPAALATKTGAVGVLATTSTLMSAAFQNTVTRWVDTQKNVRLIARSGRGIVELIESGQMESANMRALLAAHAQAFRAEHIDQLVLGCTHYPYLRPLLQELLPAVSIIDSGAAVARQSRRILAQWDLLNDGVMPARHQCFCTAESAVLSQFVPEHCSAPIVVDSLG